MEYKETIKLNQETVKEFQRLLDMQEVDFEAEDVDTDAELLSKTVKFDNGYEADMNVCSGQQNLWVDVVLFNNGYEINVAEPSDILLGETCFYVGGDTFIVDVEQEQL